MTPSPTDPVSPSADFTTECDVLRAVRSAPELLERITASSKSELHLQQELRADFPDAVVRAALLLVELRQKGGSKFTRAEQMWFDRQGLEQSTGELVARHKAQRFSGETWDLCCGIGGDAAALASHVAVRAVDLNPAHCLRTEWNAEVYGVRDRIVTECRAAEAVDSRERLVHIDPDRRRHGPARSVRIEEYEPGLEFLHQLQTTSRGGAIKLSPACNFGGKFQNVEHELISLHGECKEATIWFGELAGSSAWRATVLPAGASLAGDPLQFLAARADQPLAYLYDPDPAVVRAGLVDMLAEQADLQRLDDAEEYLTADRAVPTPFAQTFEILAELPNNEREIRAWFRHSQAGQVEIKCRRIPVQAEVVRRKLELPGNEPVVLVYARIQGKARALICRRFRPVDATVTRPFASPVPEDASGGSP